MMTSEVGSEERHLTRIFPDTITPQLQTIPGNKNNFSLARKLSTSVQKWLLQFHTIGPTYASSLTLIKFAM